MFNFNIILAFIKLSVRGEKVELKTFFFQGTDSTALLLMDFFWCMLVFVNSPAICFIQHEGTKTLNMLSMLEVFTYTCKKSYTAYYYYKLTED